MMRDMVSLNTIVWNDERLTLPNPTPNLNVMIVTCIAPMGISCNYGGICYSGPGIMSFSCGTSPGGPGGMAMCGSF